MELTKESQGALRQLKDLLVQANELVNQNDFQDLRETLTDCALLCNHIIENSRGNN
jgi:hypothetical protein